MGCVNALEALGVNVKEGLDRVMGDEDLYEMMLGMFVEMIEESPIQPGDFEQENYDELTKQIHTLKGTTGNLSIDPLFDGYKKTLELLRAEKPLEAKAAFEEIQPMQAKILDCIRQNGNAG